VSDRKAESGRPALSKVASLVDFHELMPFRVQEILLVSSVYDSFILHEEGQLNELILGEFLELNMLQTPGLTHVSSGAEALALAGDSNRYNLIITTLNPGDMDAAQLAGKLRESGIDTPVVVLGYDNRELSDFAARHPDSSIDRMYLWQGNARILFAIVKNVEDERNAPHDALRTGIRVILVVEDNVRYYSAFLPTIYTELIHQSQSLIGEGMNLSHKVLRLMARPKILLCTTFEEAWRNYSVYRNALIGVISDIEFPREGKLSREAGFDLVDLIRRESPDIPILLQSSHPEYEMRARAAGTSFLLKGSPTLLANLRDFMVEQFAFGDFVFRLPDGTEVGRASDLKGLEALLQIVPAESIAFHGERNHFSNWLTARTEIALARKLKPRKVADFPTHEDLRRDLIASIAEYRREQAEELVSDFDPATFDPTINFMSRIGGGSMGGKARGLAFVRHILNTAEAARWFPGVRIAVPPCVVLATDVFDRFMAANGLLDAAMSTGDDQEIHDLFMTAVFSEDVMKSLASFLDVVRYPLSVRSSSLLEDSQYRPFTGVYATYMLANDHPDPRIRLGHLVAAIKRVYASTFSEHAKSYVKATPYRLEEEKMAVIVQKLVGSAHRDRFYPHFAGVARSHNFYPSPPQVSEDGIAAVALGLGRTVVEGEKCLTFCPRYPRHLVQFSSVEDMLNNSQRTFWALEIERDRIPDTVPDLSMRETSFGLEIAEQDGTLQPLASTYSPENQAVFDGIGRKGIRLVSFAPVLKHNIFPLPDILERLLESGAKGMGKPVEIEFAVRLDPGGGISEFGFLQMRPLVLAAESDNLDIEDAEADLLLCRSSSVLGNGRIENIRDVVVVDVHRFDRSRSLEAALDVARYNAELVSEGAPYILIGVGRWGSMDPWLGIPVSWDQISGAQVIVETGFKDIRVQPSQGSHFFQNLTAFQIGYFTVNPEMGEGFVDWTWLGAETSRSSRGFVRHLRFERPLVVKMNGRTNRGIIYKPGRAGIPA
jgi:CheY-like chemotaxis protein